MSQLVDNRLLSKIIPKIEPGRINAIHRLLNGPLKISLSDQFEFLFLFFCFFRKCYLLTQICRLICFSILFLLLILFLFFVRRMFILSPASLIFFFFFINSEIIFFNSLSDLDKSKPHRLQILDSWIFVH